MVRWAHAALYDLPAIIALVQPYFMQGLKNFYLHVDLIFFLIPARIRELAGAARWADLITPERMVSLTCDLFRRWLSHQVPFVSRLPAFLFAASPPAVRDVFFFPDRRLARWQVRICAVPSKKGFCMGQSIR